MIFKKTALFLLCMSEEMYPHVILYMETFSYFVRSVYFLVLTFYQVNKTGPKIDPKMLKQ